jgi:hypothetical protein
VCFNESRIASQGKSRYLHGPGESVRQETTGRKEVNRGKKETRLVKGAPELERSERGAKAIASQFEGLTGKEDSYSILVPLICLKMTEPI